MGDGEGSRDLYPILPTGFFLHVGADMQAVRQWCPTGNYCREIREPAWGTGTGEFFEDLVMLREELGPHRGSGNGCSLPAENWLTSAS